MLLAIWLTRMLRYGLRPTQHACLTCSEECHFTASTKHPADPGLRAEFVASIRWMAPCLCDSSYRGGGAVYCLVLCPEWYGGLRLALSPDGLPVVHFCGIMGSNKGGGRRCTSHLRSSVATQPWRRRTTVGEEITIQHWMILALLFFLDVVVLGCLFLIAMNKIYLLP